MQKILRTKTINKIKMKHKILLLLIICILASSLVSASTTYTWNTESQFVTGSSPVKVQINLDNPNLCDAKLYFFDLGYYYPGLDMNIDSEGICTKCASTGTFGLGLISYIPLNQDPFFECNGVSCSNYYVQTGTEDQLGTEHCYDRTDEPASTHYCSGSGSCLNAAQVCPDNSADTLKYSCGTCKYISASSCTGTTLGSCSNYVSGTDTGLCGECNGAGSEQVSADDSACGTIDCDGLNNYYTSGTASATGTNYCKYRNYADITSNRCEGLSDCKDANSADCTSYSDSTAATCGTCKYAQGACSSCYNYASGTDTGLCRECNGAGSEQVPADDSACGTIDCDGRNYYYTSGTASATGTNYCKYRDYADITSNRCEGLSDCKDANSADCISYSDSTAATCGTCKYAQGACSSCTNYGSGTSCGSGKECDGIGNCVASCTPGDYYDWSGTCASFCASQGGSAGGIGRVFLSEDGYGADCPTLSCPHTYTHYIAGGTSHTDCQAGSCYCWEPEFQYEDFGCGYYVTTMCRCSCP